MGAIAGSRRTWCGTRTRSLPCLLCNLDNIGEAGGATRLSQQIADIYLSDVLGPEPPGSKGATSPVPLSREQLASKVGLYRDMADDS